MLDDGAVADVAAQVDVFPANLVGGVVSAFGRGGHAVAEPHDAPAYRTFLEQIGYLRPVGEPFAIDPGHVDREITDVAGPQLVVPVTNARYAINAANARWGSLYDALYGTDALGDAPEPGPYDSARGARVIAWARNFLDRAWRLFIDDEGALLGSIQDVSAPEDDLRVRGFDQGAANISTFTSSEWALGMNFGIPVTELIVLRLPTTIELGFYALTLAVLVGIPFGFSL